MLDNTVVRFDPGSYHEMEKDDSKDLEQCEVAWSKKIVGEMMKRGIEKNEDGKYVKHRKTSLRYLGKENDCVDYKENELTMNDSEMKDGTIDGTVESTDDKLVVEDEVSECAHCGEDPCVWLTKKEDMRIFDVLEHGHLPVEGSPPNNIRRKKVYRQMFLYINQGPSGAGVRIELPECVEDGTRAMFPSPCFMGFKRSG
jgi:hypothetical protein